MDLSFATVDNTGIYGFVGEYRWLSNFHACDVIINDKVFPSSEHAYVYSKLTDEDREIFYNDIILMTSAEIKKWGRMIDIRPDWDQIKLRIMEDVIFSKFILNSDLKQKLLDTGDLYLEETNCWKDTFWGVYKGTGKNNLGKILMKVRNEIKWI